MDYSRLTHAELREFEDNPVHKDAVREQVLSLHADDHAVYLALQFPEDQQPPAPGPPAANQLAAIPVPLPVQPPAQVPPQSQDLAALLFEQADSGTASSEEEEVKEPIDTLEAICTPKLTTSTDNVYRILAKNVPKARDLQNQAQARQALDNVLSVLGQVMKLNSSVKKRALRHMILFAQAYCAASHQQNEAVPNENFCEKENKLTESYAK